MEYKNENGKIVIENKVLKDIAQVATLKVKGVSPYKKENDFVTCKFNEDELFVNVLIKIKQDSSIDKICNKVQKNIQEAIEDMTGVKCNNINIEIAGFVN